MCSRQDNSSLKLPTSLSPVLGKGTLKMWLSWRSQGGKIIPYYLDWSNIITWVLIRRRQVFQSQRRCDDRSRGWSDMTINQAKKWQQLLEVGGATNGFSPNTSRKNTHPLTDFSPLMMKLRPQVGISFVHLFLWGSMTWTALQIPNNQEASWLFKIYYSSCMCSLSIVLCTKQTVNEHLGNE